MQIDTLDDIDFARSGPVWAIEPERGPGAAAFGHMIEVQDNEAVVVGFLALNTHGVATATSPNVGGVGGHADIASGTAEEASGLCFFEGDIVHVAIGRIVTLRNSQRDPVRGARVLTVKKSNMLAKLDGS